MTKDQAVQRVLEIARAEIGYREKNSAAGLDDKAANAGSGNYTKYARDLDAISGFYNGPKQGFPWCDCWYDWLLVKAFGPDLARRMLCQPENSAGAGCYYSALYYRQSGRFHDSKPEPGDQIFFTYQAGEVSHTGIVEAVSGGIVTTIEGNSSDGVVRRSYAYGSRTIYGYGQPDWSLAADFKMSAGTPQNDQQNHGIPGSDPPALDFQISAGTPQNNQQNHGIPGSDPPAEKTYTVTLPELRRGDTGAAVERLQTLLIGRGYYCGGRLFSGREQPDGEFGPATEVAVLDVQEAGRLTKDGIVGADTMRELLTT